MMLGHIVSTDSSRKAYCKMLTYVLTLPLFSATHCEDDFPYCGAEINQEIQSIEETILPLEHVFSTH